MTRNLHKIPPSPLIKGGAKGGGSHKSFIFLFCIFFLNCSSTSSLTFQTTDVTLTSTQGRVVVHAETADTAAKRMQGLMNRHELSDNAGMIFIFDTEDLQSFWMKDTYVALDMIFISSAHEIVYIEHNTTPLSEATIAPTIPAQYVLEVNAGFCEAHAIAVGDTAQF